MVWLVAFGAVVKLDKQFACNLSRTLAVGGDPPALFLSVFVHQNNCCVFSLSLDNENQPREGSLGKKTINPLNILGVYFLVSVRSRPSHQRRSTWDHFPIIRFRETEWTIWAFSFSPCRKQYGTFFHYIVLLKQS
jgi:hypothetical protein